MTISEIGRYTREHPGNKEYFERNNVNNQVKEGKRAKMVGKLLDLIIK